MNKGWICLNRSLMDSPIYFAEKFTRTQAWIDILLLANYEDGVIYVRGNRVEIHRGQVARSKENLADRWSWSRGKVIAYLNELQKEGMIEQQKSNVMSLISVVNYDKYQIIEQQNEQQNIQQNEQQIEQQIEQLSKQEYNKYNNNKAKAMSSASDDAEKENVIFDFEELKKYFNEKMTNKSIPQITLINDRRKSFVKARCREYGKQAIADVVQKAARSDFLNGGGATGFIASFDWIFKPTNFPKILEGNYDNNKIQTNGTQKDIARHQQFPITADERKNNVASIIKGMRAEDLADMQK